MAKGLSPDSAGFAASLQTGPGAGPDDRYRTIRTIVEHLRSKDAADGPIVTEAVAALAGWDEEKPYKRVPLNDVMFESVILRTPVTVTLPVDFAAFDADPSMHGVLMSGFVSGILGRRDARPRDSGLVQHQTRRLPREDFDAGGRIWWLVVSRESRTSTQCW